MSSGEPPPAAGFFGAPPAPALRIASRGEPPAAGFFAAGAPPPALRIASRGLPPPAAFPAAGFFSAFAGSAAFSFLTGSSTTVRKLGSMSYQPISAGPLNSTRARQLMFTVLTLPVRPENRRSSGVVLSTTTHLSVRSRLSCSACSIDIAVSLLTLTESELTARSCPPVFRTEDDTDRVSA